VNEKKEQIDLEISPFALCTAADVKVENTESSIEQDLADAMVNIMESMRLNIQFLGFK
jgi:DNA-binding transcriptional regulator WhiA